MAARTISQRTQIAAGAEQVLRAFLEPAALQQWWGASRALVEPRKGGLWAVAWERSERGYKNVASGVIRSLRPGRWLRVEPLAYINPQRRILGPLRLTVTVREKNGRCRLNVRHGGFQRGPDWDWYFEASRRAWRDALANLKDFLEATDKH